MSASPQKFPAGGNAPSASTVPIGVRTRSVVPSYWILAAFAVATAAAAVVFVLLPGWLEPPPTSVQSAPKAAAAPAPARAPDAAETVRQRLAAEEAKSDYEKRLKSVREQAAEAWAAEDLAAAVDIAASAAAAVASGDYVSGAQRYGEAARQLTEIAGRAENVYADALKRGEAAILAGDQQQAVEAFRLALAIHPEGAPAQAGLARARELDRVLAHMESGDTHAQAGEWEAAREDYASAAKRDPAFVPAQAALARAERHLADRRFAQLVTRGLAHLDHSEWTDAAQAFRSAARLRPGDRSAADGLARAEEGLERQRLAELRSEAQNLEATERWTRALDVYRRALAVDPTLDFAKSGIERSERMVRLHAELDALLADPKRLYSPTVRDAARKVLASAESAPAGGPRLTQARERLDTALRRATTPIAVRLTSDDATEVTVYRVGPLGRFQSREIELAPGTYTVVGSRAGYKDVRIELTVEPDAPSPRVFVACKEPV
ncbi:MAG: hypothetical protein LJE97_12630 [Betaproteobacteria bacterium]|nr:hypothetical protein [Betaproteobacteria bacterium]